MPSQLQINQGPQDALLYDNSRSYFTNQGYSRTSNFQVELKDLNSTSTAGWGQSIRFPISKSGDLLGPCDLLMNFDHGELDKAMDALVKPTTTGAPDVDCSAAWVEALGFAMIRRVKFEVGTMTVEEISGDQMYIQNELMKDQHHRLGVHTIAKTGRPSQRGTFSGLGTSRFAAVRPADTTVNNGSRLICSKVGTADVTKYDSKQLIIPLGMFFMKGPGSYFPLCAIAGCHEVTITVELRNLNELLVIKSAPAVSSEAIVSGSPAAAGPSITNTSIKIDKCVMRCHYVHVTGPEATLTMNKEHVRLMKLWTPSREVFFEVDATALNQYVHVPKQVIDLPFLHPISELICIIRRQTEMGTSTDPAMNPNAHDQGSQSKNRFALHGGGNAREPNLDHGARCYADQKDKYASTTIDVKSINVRLNGSSRHPDLQATTTVGVSGQAIDRHYLQHRLMPMLHSNTGTLMQDVFAGHDDTTHNISVAVNSVAGVAQLGINDYNKYNFEALSEMVDRKEIFVFPFSLSPESQQPSGAVNFSKVSQAYLEIDMQSYSTKTGKDKFQIDVWGVHYNWMMCKDGKCQLSFA